VKCGVSGTSPQIGKEFVGKDPSEAFRTKGVNVEIKRLRREESRYQPTGGRCQEQS